MCLRRTPFRGRNSGGATIGSRMPEWCRGWTRGGENDTVRPLFMNTPALRACLKTRYRVEQATGLCRRATSPSGVSAAGCRPTRAGGPFHPPSNQALNQSHPVGAPRITRLGAHLQGFDRLRRKVVGAQKGEQESAAELLRWTGFAVGRVKRGAPPTAWFRIKSAPRHVVGNQATDRLHFAKIIAFPEQPRGKMK